MLLDDKWVKSHVLVRMQSDELMNIVFNKILYKIIQMAAAIDKNLSFVYTHPFISVFICYSCSIGEFLKILNDKIQKYKKC